MTAICIPIFLNGKTDIEEAVAEAEDALRDAEPAGGGMIELRCDTATSKQMLEALDLARLPVIVTIRPTWEGGFSPKSDKDRIAFWEEAMDAGANYIDVELVAWEKSKTLRETVGETAEKTGTRLILSNHSFGGRPRDLDDRIRRLREVKEASILKLAWKAESLIDGLDALALTGRNRKEDGRPMVALAMGEEGQISRLLAKKFGAPFTFATAGRGKESAPGQPTAEELLTRYRWRGQGKDSPVFGVAGWPVSHSLSPHIHNAGFDQVRSDGIYIPLPIQPTYQAFRETIDKMRSLAAMNLRGLSVTIPHKEHALRYALEQNGNIDDVSRTIGVVNTLLFDRGGVRALNSDYAGALDALVTGWSGRREDVKGKRIAVLGAGGAARAIIAGLAAHGAAVIIYNRTQEKAEALATEFSAKFPDGKVIAAPWDKICAGGQCCDAYINCTPLGMHPNVNTSPLDGAPPEFPPETVVFDTVYNPLRTKFLKYAESRQARTIPGTEMFVRQAAIQFRGFTGQEPPLATFREVLLRELTRRQ